MAIPLVIGANHVVITPAEPVVRYSLLPGAFTVYSIGAYDTYCQVVDAATNQVIISYDDVLSNKNFNFSIPNGGLLTGDVGYYLDISLFGNEAIDAEFDVIVDGEFANTNPVISQSFLSISPKSLIGIAVSFLSRSPKLDAITIRIFSESAKNSEIPIGVLISSGSPKKTVMQSLIDVSSLSSVSSLVFKTNTIIKSRSALVTTFVIDKLSLMSKSVGFNQVEVGGIGMLSRSAKLGKIIEYFGWSSVSGGQTSINQKTIIGSISAVLFVPIINIGSIAISSVSSKMSIIPVNSTFVIGVSAALTLIKHKLTVTAGALSSAIAYVMNIKTAQTTAYSNFDFIEVLRIGARYFGVKSDGLYELTGNTDNGALITAALTTNESNFGTDNLKNVVQVYPDSEDDCTVQAIVDGDQKTEHLSTFSGRKVKLGRGAIGRWWQLKIKNVSGKLLRMVGITALVDIKSKRM